MKTFLKLLMLYSGITLIMTYPLVFNLRTHVPGGGDVWQNMWLLWHTKLSLIDPVESLYYTNYLFYPTGTPLIPMSLYNQLLSVPLQYIFSLSVTYNILFLSSFILAGTTSFFLIKYFTGNSYAAFIGGLIYAFAPNTLAHALGQMEAITTGWIPLYILFLFKLAEEKNGFKKEAKSAFLAALGLIMVAASDFIYMIFSIIFTGFFVTYWAVAKRSMNFLISRRFIMFCIFFLIGVLPFTLPLIQVSLSGQNFLKPQFDESVTYSSDFMGFFIPSVNHTFFGSYMAPFSNQFTGNYGENTTFLGYTIIIFITYLFILYKNNGQNVVFWKISFIFTFLLSLGPVLHIMGRILFNGYHIYLPYYVLYNIVPFLQNARTIGRIDVLVMLSAAVLVGYGISHLTESLSANKKKIAIILLSFLILFEFMVVPFPLSKIDAPEFYTNLANDDRKDIALVEVPSLWNYDYGIKTMYYQTIHGKKITSGALARVPPYVYEFIDTTPVLYELNYNKWKLINDIIIQSEPERAQSGIAALNKYDIIYIILSLEYLTEDQLANGTHILQEIGAQKILQTEQQIVYEIPIKKPMKHSGLEAKLRVGWHRPEFWDITTVRYINNEAILEIFSDVNRTAILNFEAMSFNRPRNLEISKDNNQIFQGIFKNTNFINTVVSINLNEGENFIKLYVSEGCERPIDIPTLNSKDNRCLSLAIKNITLTPNSA